MAEQSGFKFYRRNVQVKSDAYVKVAINIIATNVLTRAIESMKHTKVTERMGKVTFISVAGNPPSVQTGTLMGSIAIKSEGENKLIGTTMKYAKALEYGYEKRNLLPRPYLRPALDYAYKRMRKLLRRIPKI